MSSTQEFRRRIKSVNNTKQITKAMEMIASIKMQKSVKTISEARTYIQDAWNILNTITKKVLPEDHPLIKEKPVKNTAVILITSDRGLCGSYNAEVIRKLSDFSKQLTTENGQQTTDNPDLDIVAIGKVGAAYVKRYKLGNLIAEFKGFENNISVEDVIPISKMTSGEFLAGKYDKVIIIYSHFASSIKQIPVIQQLLPIVDEHIDTPEVWNNSGQLTTDNGQPEYKFEPDETAVIDGVLRQILRVQLFGAILEANASEHSARMVAMKNATDNATSLIDELTLIYNTIRQGNITTEISEISAAAEAMK